MTDNAELARRVQILEDIEAIKQLKFKYWNSVDGQRWDDLASCLAEGFTFASEQGGLLGRIEGKTIFPRVLKRIMRGVTTCHQGHNPVIEITGETTARGDWSLNDRVESPGGGYFRGHGRYQDEYVKEADGWKVLSSELSYTFTEQSPEQKTALG